jgi:autotransporter-associated beta strand protein
MSLPLAAFCRFERGRLTLILIACLGCMATIPGTAATVSWEGNTSAAWATGSNWGGGTAPANDTTSDLAAFVFGSLPSYQPNAGSTSIAGLVIGDGITTVPAFTLTGTSLTIGGSGIAKMVASGSTTISSSIVLAVAQTWSNEADSPLVISGSVATDGHLLTIGGSGSTNMAGLISGSAGLRKEGTGRLSLAAANTFTGGVTIAGGEIEAGKSGTAETLGPDTNTLTFSDAGGTLVLADDIADSDRTYSLLAPATIDTASHALTLRGPVTGASSLTKTGLGRLRLQGVNTFSGTVVVTSGSVELAGSTALADTAAVVIANDAAAVLRVATTETIGSLAGGGPAGGTVRVDATLTVGGANTNTSFGGWLDGASALIKTGSGTLLLTNTTTNDAYTGRVDILGGTVSISAVESLGKRGTSRELHLSNGAVLETTADMSFNTRVFQLFDPDGQGIAGRFDVAAGTSLTLKNNVQGLAGSGGLLKEGGGLMSLDPGAVRYKNYQGPTVVSSGTLRVNAQLTQTGTLTVVTGATLSGTGRIDNAVTTIGGTHAPGASLGIQQFGVDNSDVGNLTYLAGSSVVWELVASTTASRGSAYDGVDLVGATSTLTFSDSTALHLSFSETAPGLTPVSWSDSFWNTDQAWLVYDVAGATAGAVNFSVSIENWLDASGGQFNTIRPGATFSLQQTGQDVVLVYAVPEPSACAIIVVAAGLASLIRTRRRHIPDDRLPPRAPRGFGRARVAMESFGPCG